MTSKIFNKTARALLLALLVITPLVYGAVHVWAYTLMEMVVLAIVTLALMKMIWCDGEIRWVKHPANIFLGIFCVYVCMQMVTLPGPLIKAISPEVINIHQKYLAWFPGVADDNRFAISLNVHKTKIELFKILAYIGVFLFTINRVRKRQHINYVLAAIFLLGCFEASYGIYQKLAEIDSVEWAKRKSLVNSAVSGTYINRNNFAGYLEMVIVLLFGQVIYFFSGRKKKRSKGHDAGHKFSLGDYLSNEDKYSKIFLGLLALFMMGTAVMVSQSRGGILSIAVGMSVAIFFSFAGKGFKRPAFFFAPS